MRRGEVWIAAGGKDYIGQPRPVVIVQDDRFDATASITVCAFTTDETDLPLLRVLVSANAANGPRAPCRLMVDKVTTMPKSKLGKRIGRIDEGDVQRLDRALVTFLELAEPQRAIGKPI